MTIKVYWNLIGREPFSAIITWEPDFSQVCSFCRMLKDHNNFCFTTIPAELCFLALFDHFRHHFFQKNHALSHITNYGPLTPYISFAKNKWANSEKTYGQTRGRTDYRADDPYQPLFIGPIWSCPGVQQEKPQKKCQVKHCVATLNTARAICWK